mgnify:CR=1 FL=1
MHVIENDLVVHQREAGRLYMRKGEMVPSHAHNFGHPTFVHSGAIRFDLLKILREDVLGRPLELEIEQSTVVRAEDEANWFYTHAGRWHQLTALENDTRYGCHVTVRGPSCLTTQRQGSWKYEPPVRLDEHGRRWVCIDESIAAHTRETALWLPGVR